MLWLQINMREKRTECNAESELRVNGQDGEVKEMLRYSLVFVYCLDAPAPRTRYSGDFSTPSNANRYGY